jgi:multidrug efflux system membrane fusion protein
MTTEGLDENFAADGQPPPAEAKAPTDELKPPAGRVAAPPGVLAPGVSTPGVKTPGVSAPGRKRGRLRSGLLWIAALVVLGLGARAWINARSAQDPADAASAQTAGKYDRGGAQPVGAATVVRRDVRVMLNALGTVTPLATVTVVSQISGVLQQVGFVEGQKVQKGDFLAQIDDRPYRALKAQYEGQLAHDQGLLEQARVDDVRYAQLLKQNSIARQTAEDQKYVVKQYEGTVVADQAQIDAQALNIGYCHLVSPVDGRVGLRLIDPGNYITAGSATSSSSSSGIVVVTQTQPISVVFSIPEDSLRRVAPQLRAGVALATEVYDRANVKLLGKGETRAIDNQVDSTTGMVKLRAVFDNADEALFANQFVNVRLLASTIPGALAAPISGIQHGAPGDYAWVISPENEVSVHTVKLGQMDGDIVQILDGLREGDRIVIDGADRLRESGKVRVVANDSAQATADAQGAGQDASSGLDASKDSGASKDSSAGKSPDDAAREERRRKWRERKAQESGKVQESGKAQEGGAAAAAPADSR